MTRQSLLTRHVVPAPADAVLPPYHVPWCFGCGPENEHGLGLQARLEGDKVVADLRLAPWFAGGPGVAHGGAVAAFFDDLMGFVPVAHLAPAVASAGGSLRLEHGAEGLRRLLESLDVGLLTAPLGELRRKRLAHQT